MGSNSEEEYVAEAWPRIVPRDSFRTQIPTETLFLLAADSYVCHYVTLDIEVPHAEIAGVETNDFLRGKVQALLIDKDGVSYSAVVLNDLMNREKWFQMSVYLLGGYYQPLDARLTYTPGTKDALWLGRRDVHLSTSDYGYNRRRIPLVIAAKQLHGVSLPLIARLQAEQGTSPANEVVALFAIRHDPMLKCYWHFIVDSDPQPPYLLTTKKPPNFLKPGSSEEKTWKQVVNKVGLKDLCNKFQPWYELHGNIEELPETLYVENVQGASYEDA